MELDQPKRPRRVPRLRHRPDHDALRCIHCATPSSQEVSEQMITRHKGIAHTAAMIHSTSPRYVSATTTPSC